MSSVMSRPNRSGPSCARLANCGSSMAYRSPVFAAGADAGDLVRMRWTRLRRSPPPSRGSGQTSDASDWRGANGASLRSCLWNPAGSNRRRASCAACRRRTEPGNARCAARRRSRVSTACHPRFAATEGESVKDPTIYAATSTEPPFVSLAAVRTVKPVMPNLVATSLRDKQLVRPTFACSSPGD